MTGVQTCALPIYFGISFPQNFTHGALLITECLSNYYRTRELTVTEYVGENYDPVDHHIREVAVTNAEPRILLDELWKAQDPKHELYQSWLEEDTRQE